MNAFAVLQNTTVLSELDELVIFYILLAEFTGNEVEKTVNRMHSHFQGVNVEGPDNEDEVLPTPTFDDFSEESVFEKKH